jgi:uncharacterized coiled-coil protein SlyX
MTIALADVKCLIKSIVADYPQDEVLTLRLSHLSELITPQQSAINQTIEKLDSLRARLAQVQIENEAMIQTYRSANDE